MKIKNFVKAVAFVAIFALLYSQVTRVLTKQADYRNFQWVAGFYEEEPKTLDAVYIGSSNCYAFWNPLVAWQEYGITVYPFSTDSQPFAAAKYLIEESRKTQPDALFIVNVNAIDFENLKLIKLHNLLDYMPFSLNKIVMTKDLAEVGGYTLEESMELYLPIIKYHDRWDEITPDNFEYEVDGLKGASNYSRYLIKSEDLTESYITSDKETELSEEVAETLYDLLDYCDEESVNVLFVTVPRVENDEALVQKLNKANSIIASRGYPILNLNDKVDEVGLNLEQDYYNERHTNIHGSIKFTRYLSEYLIENYGFVNKQGTDEVYNSWDSAWERYAQMIAPFVLNLELDDVVYDNHLARPSELKAVTDDRYIYFSWVASEGADGYVIYRRDGDGGSWNSIAETTGLEYTDADIVSGVEYRYTAVPFYEKDGARYYGNFSYRGVDVPAP